MNLNDRKAVRPFIHGGIMIGSLCFPLAGILSKSDALSLIGLPIMLSLALILRIEKLEDRLEAMESSGNP